MAKKIQTEKTKGNKNLDTTIHRITKDFSTSELREAFAKKMIELARNKKYTLMTQVAMEFNYSFEALIDVAKKYPEIQEAYSACKLICGMNAYQGIEDRSLSGTFSKYSVTKYNTEVRQERDRIKLQEHEREIAKIKARQEADKQALSEFITEVREVNGKKIGVISIDENIKIGE